MIILGIDPSFTSTGLAVRDGNNFVYTSILSPSKSSVYEINQALKYSEQIAEEVLRLVNQKGINLK